MSAVFMLAAALLVGWGLYSACLPRPVFVVRISDGVPRAARGTVTRAFLRDIAETCARHGVRRGEIRGIAAGRRINLAFSGDMPEPCRQQIRNLWSLSGWSARVRAGPDGRPRVHRDGASTYDPHDRSVSIAAIGDGQSPVRQSAQAATSTLSRHPLQAAPCERRDQAGGRSIAGRSIGRR